MNGVTTAEMCATSPLGKLLWEEELNQSFRLLAGAEIEVLAFVPAGADDGSAATVVVLLKPSPRSLRRWSSSI